MDAYSTPPCNCIDCQWTRSADLAIESTGAVRFEGDPRYVLVPDVMVAEAAANGHEIPPTYRVVRSDGRACWVFTDPRIAA